MVDRGCGLSAPSLPKSCVTQSAPTLRFARRLAPVGPAVTVRSRLNEQLLPARTAKGGASRASPLGTPQERRRHKGCNDSSVSVQATRHPTESCGGRRSPGVPVYGTGFPQEGPVVVPAAAAERAQVSVPAQPDTVVRRGTLPPVPAIRHPLRDVAVHVVQSKCVRAGTPPRGRVCLTSRHIGAARSSRGTRRLPRTCRVLPVPASLGKRYSAPVCDKRPITPVAWASINSRRSRAGFAHRIRP